MFRGVLFYIIYGKPIPGKFPTSSAVFCVEALFLAENGSRLAQAASFGGAICRTDIDFSCSVCYNFRRFV